MTPQGFSKGPEDAIHKKKGKKGGSLNFFKDILKKKGDRGPSV